MRQDSNHNDQARKSLKTYRLFQHKEIDDYLSFRTASQETRSGASSHLLIRAANLEQAEAKGKALLQNINSEDDFIQAKRIENSERSFANRRWRL